MSHNHPALAQFDRRGRVPQPMTSIGLLSLFFKKRHHGSMMSVMLMPSDILDHVRAAFRAIPNGKASHNRHWINAYGLLALLPEQIRSTLIVERCPPGAGGGAQYSAASVVSDAAEMLQRRREVEIGYYSPMNATYTIDGRTFEAGFEISGIYRLLP